MYEVGQEVITVEDAALQKAAESGTEAFLQVFIDRYREVLGEGLNAGNMNKLNGEQITLLAYDMFRNEVSEGGFIQLIHNGYGPFIFDNPIAKAMRIMGAAEFSKLVYKGKRLYDKYKDSLTKDCSDEEFMALYEAYPQFDSLDDDFVEMEQDVTETLARYVDSNIELFAKVMKE